MIPIAATASFVLTLIAVIHLYWAFGGQWPGRDERSLTEIVVGPTPEGRMPGKLACIMVAVALLLAAALPLVHMGVLSWPLPNGLANAGLWVVGVVLGLRGLGGYLERRLRPKVVELPYDRLNRMFYSPLCLVLSALVTGTAIQG